MGKYPRPPYPPPPPPTNKSSLLSSSEFISPPLPPKPLRRNSSKATLDKEEFLKNVAVPPPAQPPPPIDYLQTSNNNVRLNSCSSKNTLANPHAVGQSCANISSDSVADRGKMLEQIKQGVRLKPVSERLQDSSRSAEKNVALLSTAKTPNNFCDTPLAKAENCYKRMLDSKLSKTLVHGQTKYASSKEKQNITTSTPILISKVTTDFSKWSIKRSVPVQALNRDRSVQSKSGSTVNQLNDVASTFVPVPTAFSSRPPDHKTSFSTSERFTTPRVNGTDEIKRRVLVRTVEGIKPTPAKTIRNSSPLFSSKNDVDDVFVQAMIERRKQILGIDGAEDSSEDNHNEWDDE